MYKSSQLQSISNQFQRSSNASAELIDLSSDDDSSKKKEDVEEKEEMEARTNGLQNHVFTKETSVTLIPGNTPKPGLILVRQKNFDV